METRNNELPQWLRGKSLKKDPYKIPGDPFIETILIREEGQHVRVRRSSKKNERGDPFVSHDVGTGEPVNLTDKERHQSYLDLFINPPKLLVRSLEEQQTGK